MQNNNTARMERDLSFSQEDFQRFARLSGDHNPIHVDPDYAAGARLEVQDLKFPAPAYADEPLTVVLETRGRPVDGIVHLTTDVLKEDDSRCLQGTCRLKLDQEMAP